MEPHLHSYVVSCIEGSRLTYQEIAEGSGVCKRTVEKIARREIQDPGVSHIEKLVEFFGLPEKLACAEPCDEAKANPKRCRTCGKRVVVVESGGAA